MVPKSKLNQETYKYKYKVVGYKVFALIPMIKRAIKI